VALLLPGAALLLGRDSVVPAAGEFLVIEQVPPRPPAPPPGPDASTGTFASPCGRNQNAHLNGDNVVTAPGEAHGAEHLHEYVGNESTDAYSTEQSLAAATTTCRNGDRSTYYWPVLRILAPPAGFAHTHDAGDAVHAEHAHDHDHDHDHDAPDGARGHGDNPARMSPTSVLVQFRGNPTGKVVPMPRFLPIVTGNPRAATTPAPGIAPAQWSCTGQPDRRTPRYPRCPPGQQLLRIFDFPSCWDGRRTDSPNHRAHVVFPAPDGTCPHATFPIPQLHLEVTYPIPPGRGFAVDTLPGQHHDPATDHAVFINVMSDPLMARVVTCLNGGHHC
jgi:hypothetical protein